MPMKIFITFLISFLSLLPVIHADNITDSLANNFSSKIIDKSLNSLGEAIQSIIPGEGDTEVEISSQENFDIRYSILAVRPIMINPYKDLKNEHLYFTQFRLANSEPFANGDQRVLLNLGLGFRSLVQEENAIVGVNIFYDHEFEQEHQRASLGIEYLTGAFQAYGNIYDRVSDSKTYAISSSSNATEEVLDGYDYSLVGQVPYLSWVNVVFNGYNWNKSGSDLKGKNYNLEAQLFKNLVLDVGRHDPDTGKSEDSISLLLRFPGSEKKSTLFSEFISESMFPDKNMKDEMLHKVRRTNNIVTEKRSGGIIIARGN